VFVRERSFHPTQSDRAKDDIEPSREKADSKVDGTTVDKGLGMRPSLFGEVTRLRDRNFDTGCSSTAHRQDVQVKRETGERWLWQPYLNPRTARDPEAVAFSNDKARAVQAVQGGARSCIP